MAQPAIHPRVTAVEAHVLHAAALAARGDTRRLGDQHSTPNSWRHSSQLPWGVPKRRGDVYERVGGNARDRATYSRNSYQRRLFGRGDDR